MSNGPAEDGDDFSEPDAETREAALSRVRSYLERFYRDEPDNVVASNNALLALGPDWRERWNTANAFRLVTRAAFPPGTLKELVDQSAHRLIRDDGQAREFLQEMYALSSLDTAVNYDELV
ncbi:hypothetical protein [Corallococcus llansteffanensis]|uniref:Uncharacterized protein n=1 Tax=Corallococcus llansteffanensis TaxID=2316731 RepID=A0A3A8N3D1_9BACT|nr:hypothetical protein [Corallococcus llansteffanensis]RKH38978.1 hypothetical protein D7V93_40670 [Corallococcus llansteffanensis]